MPIPVNALNQARFSGMQTVQPVINYWPAQQVVSGTLTETPTTYPIGQLNVNWTSGSPAGLRVGQLWIVRSGESVVSYGVVRLPSTSAVLYIDGKSRGDSGLARSQAFGLTAGQTITVYNYRPLWSLLSRIVDGEFFKKFDVAYTDEGENPSPVVNIGSWRQVWADSNGGAEVFFDNTNSFAWQGKTISSYNWQIPGATYVSGNSSSQNVTVRLPEGFHLVECTVTDTGGASTTAIRPVWVNGENFPPLSEKFAFEINGDTQDRRGRNQSLTFVGQLDTDEYLPGMAVHYNEIATYDGSEMSPASLLISNFAGFASEEARTHDLLTGEKATSFEVFGPWAWMEMIPMVSQAIVEVEAPEAWTDIRAGLGIPQFIIWYVLKHHSSFLDLFDYDPFFEFNEFTGGRDDPRKLNWGLNGSTLAEYVSQVSKSIGGNAGCKSNGALAFRRDPNIESAAYRDSVDERMTLQVDEDYNFTDFAEPVEVNKRFHNEIGQLRVFTLSFDGGETTAFGSIAPGYTQMQAPGSQDEDSYIVKPDQGIAENVVGYRPGGQLRTNMLAGHLLAKTNNPTPEISMLLVRNMDFFDPAEMAWVRLEIPADWSSRGEAISTRALPTSVDRSWEEGENGAFVKSIALSVEPETFGQPGETYNIDTGIGESYLPEIPPIDIDLPDDDRLVKDAGVIFAINEAGEIGRTSDGEKWTNIRNNVVHESDGGSIKFNDLALDYFSPYVLSGYSEGALGAWAAVAKEFAVGSGIHRVAQIWRTEDIRAQTVVWSLQYETDQANSDCDGSLRLRSNPEIEGYVAMAIGTANGIFIARTTDGVNWNLAPSGTIVSNLSLNAAVNEIDFCFNNSRIICSGWDSGDQTWKLTRSSSPTSGFVYVANSPNSDIPWSPIEKHIESGTVYATRVLQEKYLNTQTATVQVTEESPQTFLNSPGTRVPVINAGLSGGMIESEWNITIRGDPNEGVGFNDPEPRTIAGYHDAFRTNPTTSICGPNLLLEYSRDDGWHWNSSIFPAIQDEPNDLTKFYVYTGISGDFDWRRFEAYGYFTYTLGTTSFVCNALSSSILFYLDRLELYDEYGILIDSFGAVSNLDSDGWSNDYDSTLLPIQDVAVAVFRVQMAGSGFGEYMLPTCKFLEWEIENVTVEEPALFAIDFISGANPSYNNITPTSLGNPNDTFLPRTPYSLAIDSANSSRITSAARRTTNGGGSFIATSSSGGTFWSVNDNTQVFLRGLRVSNDFGLAWGYNRLLLTDDGFDTSIDLRGNWDQVFGAEPEVIRTMKAILIPEY